MGNWGTERLGDLPTSVEEWRIKPWSPESKSGVQSPDQPPRSCECVIAISCSVVFPTRFYLIPFQGSPSGTVTYVGQDLMQPCQRGTCCVFLRAPVARLAGATAGWHHRSKDLQSHFQLWGRKPVTKQPGSRERGGRSLWLVLHLLLPPPRERAHEGRRLVRWGCKTRRKTLEVVFWIDPLASVSTYFLCCNTTCRPSPGPGTAEARQPYSLRGQAPALRLHGCLSDCCGGCGWCHVYTMQWVHPKPPPPHIALASQTLARNLCGEGPHGKHPSKSSLAWKAVGSPHEPSDEAPSLAVCRRSTLCPPPASCCRPRRGCPAPPAHAAARPLPQRLSPRLRWAGDHRRAAVSAPETSDSVGARVIHLFLEKFSTRRSYTLQITETHASMKFNF